MLVRVLRAAAAQMGPTQKADSREHTLGRMLELLEKAAACGATLVVFPELAFTTFFPRWLIEDEALDHYFERGMPNPAVQSLFDRSRALGIGSVIQLIQQRGAIGAPLPASQSFILIWPQLTGLVAATIAIFVAAYIAFQRQEIRA